MHCAKSWSSNGARSQHNFRNKFGKVPEWMRTRANVCFPERLWRSSKGWLLERGGRSANLGFWNWLAARIQQLSGTDWARAPSVFLEHAGRAPNGKNWNPPNARRTGFSGTRCDTRYERRRTENQTQKT